MGGSMKAATGRQAVGWWAACMGTRHSLCRLAAVARGVVHDGIGNQPERYDGAKGEVSLDSVKGFRVVLPGSPCGL